MSKYLSAAIAALLATAVGGCQTGQSDAQALNKEYANSGVYIGALTCNVSGSTGFILGSSKNLDCVYLTKDGVSQAYAGTIRKFGIDLGYTKAGHMVWHVFQLGGLVGSKLTTDPKVLAGGFIGEQAQIVAGAGAGSNWLYGGANNQVVLQATDIQGGNAGYNLAYGVAEISLSPR
jgi:hypothetical protein